MFPLHVIFSNCLYTFTVWLLPFLLEVFTLTYGESLLCTHTFKDWKLCVWRSIAYLYVLCGLPKWLSGKEPACQCKRHGLDPSQEDPLEKEMATHYSILA